MKQIAFIFSIILLLCSCKSSESTNSNITLFQEKDIYTTGRIDTLMLNRSILTSSEKCLYVYRLHTHITMHKTLMLSIQQMPKPWKSFSWHALGLCFKKSPNGTLSLVSVAHKQKPIADKMISYQTIAPQ